MLLNFIFKIVSATFKAYWFIFYSLFVSLVIYVLFYMFYLPIGEHTVNVHFQYKTDCDQHGSRLCSFPSGKVMLHESPKASKEGYRVLTRGQGYDITLELNMPLSEENKKLGMFLAQIDFLSKRKIIESQSRSALLSFQSDLLTTLKTMVYALPLLTGWKEQRQVLIIPLVENYIDNSYEPSAMVELTLHSKNIQIYSAKLRFTAVFTGLRYYMHHWPVTFSIIGFLNVLGVVGLFFLFRFLKHMDSNEQPYAEYGDLSDNSSAEDDDEEDEKENIVETVKSRDDKNSSDDMSDVAHRRKSSTSSNTRRRMNSKNELSAGSDSNYDYSM